MRHGLVQHDFGKDAADGRMDGVELRDGALRSARLGGAFAREGFFESAPVALPFPAREMVLTWNTRTPFGCGMKARFGVGSEGDVWSGWFEMGDWGAADAGGRRCEDRVFGRLEADVLRATRDFSSVRYRFDMRSCGGASPALRLVTICFSGGNLEADGTEYEFDPGSGFDLEVPWVSQFNPREVWDAGMRNAGVCAPASLVMALRRLGVRVSVHETAKAVFDYGAGIYGNWAYAAAAAGEYGLRAWVQRFSRWDDLLDLVREGVAPVISVAYEKGGLRGASVERTGGHLMVVRGWTAGGGIVCNDPAAADEERGKAVVFDRRELGRAFFGHGGAAVIVTR
ncbi:MAG: C39 family peptidase [bacterium]